MYQNRYAACYNIEGLSFESCIRSTVCNPLYEHVCDKQPNAFQSFGLLVKSHFEIYYINLDYIAPTVIPEKPSWLNRKPIVNFELTKYKKSENKPFTNSTTSWLKLDPWQLNTLQLLLAVLRMVI
jgi:hypothetical protein